jgi:hypothetical protein
MSTQPKFMSTQPKLKSIAVTTLSAAEKKVLVKAAAGVLDPNEPIQHASPALAKTKGIATGKEANLTGVYGYSEGSIGVCGESPVLAGFFKGDVEIYGDLNVESGSARLGQLSVNKHIVVGGDIQLSNADVAEDFDISGAESVQPGTFMVFDSEGTLSESYHAYDNRVAGVISGAGDHKPGLVLDKRKSPRNRQPVALMGKVFCKVDAQFGAVAVGDLLTTSPTPGHAMKAADPAQAFGAVIGKALQRLVDGQGLIPILVALQ